MAASRSPALVLVTRSEPGASATAARLAEAGLAPLRTPMLAVSPRPAPADVRGAQAVLVTSAHAARRLADAAAPLPPVYAVGGATAEAARAAGARDVVSADGAAAALVELVRDALDPAAGPLAFWRGEDVAADVAGLLRAAGFEVAEHVVYAAAPVALAPEAEAALRAGRVAAVLFHSARGCTAFMDAVHHAGLEAGLTGVVAASLSPQAGAPARDGGFAAYVAAAQPLEKSMIDVLIETLERRS